DSPNSAPSWPWTRGWRRRRSRAPTPTLATFSTGLHGSRHDRFAGLRLAPPWRGRTDARPPRWLDVSTRRGARTAGCYDRSDGRPREHAERANPRDEDPARRAGPLVQRRRRAHASAAQASLRPVAPARARR